MKDQNFVQMYNCISNIIIKASHLNILVESLKYIVQGTTVGEILFKVLMQKSVVDTRTTASNHSKILHHHVKLQHIYFQPECEGKCGIIKGKE